MEGNDKNKCGCEGTVVSRVSAHGRLNIHHDFGPHGRLPRT